MTKIFQIGNFIFQLEYPVSLQIPENFLLFESPDSDPEYFYEIAETNLLPEPQGKLLVQKEDLTVYDCAGLETRKIYMRGNNDYYACYQEISSRKALIFIRSDVNNNPETSFWLDTTFTSLFALERHISSRGFLILHCAYLYYRDKAILFSAPSGVGKSTQAELWHKYRSASIINGDRALLGKNGTVWSAYGWPVCGSSEICHNKTTPVCAIVMLSQGNANQIRKLTPIQAFSEIYGQITVNRWDSRSVKQTADQLEDLITRIPTYHLNCTISEEAVDCLDNILQIP